MCTAQLRRDLKLSQKTGVLVADVIISSSPLIRLRSGLGPRELEQKSKLESV